MSSIIHAENQFERKLIPIKEFARQLNELYRKAEENWQNFVELAEEDITEAIRQLPRFIRQARSINGKNYAFAEGLAGGPNHNWIVPLFNVIGEFYPNLERATREVFLGQCLGYLDGINCIYSQNHVKEIQEPSLITDIVTTRWLYWPGTSEEKELFEKFGTSPEGVRENVKCIETFWMCFSLIIFDTATLPVRQWYYGQYPELVDKTLDFVAAQVHTLSEQKVKEKGGSLETHISSILNEVYDCTLHERIRTKIIEHKWIILKE